MKILFLVSSLNAGGAERVAITLCNYWSGRGDQVKLFATYRGTEPAFCEVNHEVDVEYLENKIISNGITILDQIKRLHSLRQTIKSFRPDVIVSFLPNVNVAAILANLFLKIPLVICERSNPLARKSSNLWNFACKTTYPLADILVIQTKELEEKIHSFFPGLKKIAVIPNPLKSELLSRKRKCTNNADSKVLLSLGRLTANKQVSKAVAAFIKVADQFPEWELKIYGDGEDKASILDLIKVSKMEDRIQIMGHANDPWDIMEKSDAFIMTSKVEGFPNALLEAMGIGLPSIVFDCPSGPKELTRNGSDALLIPLNDDEKLAEGLHLLLANQSRREELDNRARDSVVLRYSISNVLAQWDDVFKEVGAKQN